MKKKTYFILILVFILILLNFLLRWRQNNKIEHFECKTDYGIDYNIERKKRGISLIPDNWFCKQFKDNSIVFSQKETKNYEINNISFYAYKTLFIRDSVLLVEEDLYWGIEKYPADPDNPEAMNTQRVEITYDYEKEKRGEYPWSVDFYHCNIGNQHSTLILADSVLNSWGLKRLDYEFNEDSAIWLK